MMAPGAPTSPSLLRVVLVVGAVAFVVATQADASSVSPIKIEGLKRASLEITVGGGLTRNGGVGLELFGGDLDRAHQFEGRLRRAIEGRLSLSGIAVDNKARSAFSLALFGRPIGLCSDRYVVLVTLEFHHEQHVGATWSKSLIEIPQAPQQEADIEAGVTALLDELLQDGRGPKIKQGETSK